MLARGKFHGSLHKEHIMRLSLVKMVLQAWYSKDESLNLIDYSAELRRCDCELVDDSKVLHVVRSVTVWWSTYS